jgi:hypothetical protein
MPLLVCCYISNVFPQWVPGLGVLFCCYYYYYYYYEVLYRCQHDGVSFATRSRMAMSSG